ncbi:MAG: carbohydrate kinase [Gammaproteobacteria bacterium]|nr:carbohydrate kinase [Gammaproteobacteria bacterium]
MSGRLCIFGEVLFDHFPDGRRVLGGAPFNVAWHLQAFGQAPRLISRVGADPEGEAIREAMREWGMDHRDLQRDGQLPTGRVAVRFVDGEPAYEIVAPCAYDRIEAPHQGTAGCRLLYHGSLALRDEASRHTASRIMACRPEMIFLDVNLRPPWWQREAVLALVQRADWVKLNGEELQQLYPGGDAAAFLAEYRLRGLLLTHGAQGAELLSAAGEHLTTRPQGQAAVVDTVGAGDAFAAVMILGLANNWPLALTLQRAQGFASALVGQRGATVADPGFYRPFIDDWQLNQ